MGNMMAVQKLTKKQVIQDLFNLPKDQHWVINESEGDSKVDGEHVLARVVGPFGLVDGVSLNNRLYTKDLWENCISKVQEKLQHGGLPGTVGHDQPLNEDALLNGKLSHTVTKLWIDESNKVLMGELLVLGTDSGRQLNHCLRAGLPIPVSSRAYGKITGVGKMGEDIIDPESFILETFDFVLNPGVETAYPKVVEQNTESTEQEDETVMDKELIEKIVKEAAETAVKITEDRQSAAKAEAEAKRLVEEHKAQAEELNAINEGLRKFLELEPFKSVAKEFGLLDASSNKSSTVISKFAEAGEKFKKAMGASKELDEAKAQLAKFAQLGTVKEIEALMTVLGEYAPVGKPAEVKTKLAKAAKLEAKILEIRRKVCAKKISNKFGTPSEVVEAMLKTTKVSEVIAQLKKIKESADLSKRYTKNGKIDESKKESKPELKSINSTATGKTLADVMFVRTGLTK